MRTSARRLSALTAPVLLVPLLGAGASVEPVEDLTGPTVKAFLTRAGVTITATDDLSGVDRIEIRRYMAADEEPDWSPYTGPFQPQAHDVPGVIEYRAVDKAGNISDVAEAPGEQNIPISFTVGNAVHGKPTTVTVSAVAPTDALGYDSSGKALKVDVTAVVRLENNREYRAKVVNGKAKVKLPAGLAAGRHVVSVWASTDFPHFYAIGDGRRFRVAKAASRVRVKVSKARETTVRITTPEKAKAKGPVTVKFVSKGKTRAVVRTRLLTSGLVAIKVPLPREVQARPGAYTVKVTYAGSKNVKGSRATSKKFTVR